MEISKIAKRWASTLNADLHHKTSIGEVVKDAVVLSYFQSAIDEAVKEKDRHIKGLEIEASALRKEVFGLEMERPND